MSSTATLVSSTPCSPPILTHDTCRAKISSQISSHNTTGNNVTGLDHVFLNAPPNRPSAVSNETTRPVTRAPIQHQNDSFTEAITRLRNNVPPTSSQNASLANPRVTFPALPPPPDTRPAARPLFRPSPNRATYSSNFRRPNLPIHFGPPMANSSPVPQPHTPLTSTPDMSKFNPIEELEALFGKTLPHPHLPLRPRSAPRDLPLPAGADSPSRNGDTELPDFGVFGPNVANLLLSQSDFLSTPQFNQTPSMVEASPDLELIAPINASRKGVQGTPNMTPNLAMTPTMASPRTLATGLYDIPIPGQFGFIEHAGGSSLPQETSLENFLQMFNSINLPAPLPPTVSPADLYTPTFTPGQPFTPGPLLDTPSVGATSPLLETPGRPTVPLIASAGQAVTTGSRKRASPLTPTKTKRERSEEGEDSLSSKRRKHTGTRPGISSAQLLPPGAPPQLKTYLTESSTSRKDVPASYKVKAGESPDDAIVNKIVAKRTANRDSARRSRQRKQQAMEFAQAQINYFKERCEHLEAFIRDNGFEPPLRPTSPVMEIDDDVE